MKRPLVALVAGLLCCAPARAEDKKPVPKLAGSDKPLVPLVSGLKSPESVCVGHDKRLYITEIGAFNNDKDDGDGRVMVVGKDGKATPFATGLNDPKGIVAFKNM